MKMHYINTSGDISHVSVSKRVLAADFDMHTRDLRPVFLLRQLFTISVRGNAIILNLGEVKLCIGQSDAYFFPMANEKREMEFSDKIREKIQNKDMEDHHIPFEFLILEVGFEFVLNNITSHFASFEKRLHRLLVKISETPSQKNFEKLLSLKKELARLAKVSQELQDAVNEVLDDEEELSSILLSNVHTEHFEEEDVESILENILEQIMEVSHKITQEKENIDDTQEIVTLKMATIRNTIIQLDLVASIGTSILAFGTLITGFYGMNIANGIEGSLLGFFIIVLGILFVSFIAFYLFFRFIKQRKIWS